MTSTAAATAAPNTEEGRLVDAMTKLRCMPPLISVSAAADLLGISRSAAYRYASLGDLPTRKLGGRVYVVTALLIDLVSAADNGNEGEAA